MSDFDHAHRGIQPPRPLTIVRPSPAPNQRRLTMPFGDWLHAWRRRREFKSLAMRLLTYDDHQLDDMGYSRQDLLAAMNQPLRLDSQHLLARWRERRLEGKAARDHAAKSRRRPDHGGIQSNALLSGIGVGAVGVVGSTDYGRRGRSGS